jgi:hypothetical protein
VTGTGSDGVLGRAAAAVLTALCAGCGAAEYVLLGMQPPPPLTSQAVVYLQRQQYDMAFDLLRTRASDGDLWGNAYLSGLLRSPGEVPAQIRQLIGDRLELLFFVGDRHTWFYPPNVPMQTRRVVQQQVDEAIAKRDPDRDYLLGIKLLSGENSLERLPQAIEHLNNAADRGNKGALVLLGHMDRRVLDARHLASRHVPVPPPGRVQVEARTVTGRPGFALTAVSDVLLQYGGIGSAALADFVRVQLDKAGLCPHGYLTWEESYLAFYSLTGFCKAST